MGPIAFFEAPFISFWALLIRFHFAQIDGLEMGSDVNVKKKELMKLIDFNIFLLGSAYFLRFFNWAPLF